MNLNISDQCIFLFNIASLNDSRSLPTTESTNRFDYRLDFLADWFAIWSFLWWILHGFQVLHIIICRISFIKTLYLSSFLITHSDFSNASLVSWNSVSLFFLLSLNSSLSKHFLKPHTYCISLSLHTHVDISLDYSTSFLLSIKYTYRYDTTANYSYLLFLSDIWNDHFHILQHLCWPVF